MIIDAILERILTFDIFLIYIPFSAVAFWVLGAAYSYFLHPYSDIPGPFWAKVSRLWLVRQVFAANLEKTQAKLHKKYGPIVRIAPNEVSISDPAAVRIIYAVNAGFTKTDFYTPFASHLSPNEDLFTQRDEKLHAQRRRFVNNLYSLSSVLESEKYVDTCSKLLADRFDEFANSRVSFDLGLWLQMYAFDVVGELFFGRQFGFMEKSYDYGGYIRSLDMLLPAVAISCVLPSYVRPLKVLGHLFPPMHRALKGYDDIVIAAKSTVANRQELMRAGKVERSDLLDKLFKIMAEKDDFAVCDITTETWVSLFAGSDTTAIAMRSIMYNLMKNRRIYDKVTAEIDQATKEGNLSDPVPYAEAIKLPYFVACVKEGFRVHPSVGMSMPRHVPESGVTIAGRFFPGGSRVGMSAAVLHFDKSIFGEDAEVYNPDRWMKPNTEVMDRHMLQFGAGPRTCVGKNISLAEIHKLLPALLRRYTFELVEPEKEISTLNYWFNKQIGINVRLTRRNV